MRLLAPRGARRQVPSGIEWLLLCRRLRGIGRTGAKARALARMGGAQISSGLRWPAGAGIATGRKKRNVASSSMVHGVTPSTRISQSDGAAARVGRDVVTPREAVLIMKDRLYRGHAINKLMRVMVSTRDLDRTFIGLGSGVCEECNIGKAGCRQALG